MSLVPPSPAHLQARDVQVRSHCWSCGTEVERFVHRRREGHRHLLWSCPACDTSWTGPGE